MDFLTAVNIIGKDLEEALTSLEQLSGISGSDKAEIELARSRIGSAASLVRLLPSLSGAPDEKEAVTGTAEAAPEEEATRKVTAVVTKAAATDPAEETTQKVSQAEAKTAVTDQAEAGTAATDPSEARATETKPVKGEPKSPEHSKAILADRFTSGGALVDKMQTEKKEEVISSVMKSKPVSDIAAAIGINDRFYFIRELFSGDALAYNDTIKRLNAAASLGEAMRILDESTVMGSDPAAQSSFVDVVRRKFSLHV